MQEAGLQFKNAVRSSIVLIFGVETSSIFGKFSPIATSSFSS